MGPSNMAANQAAKAKTRNPTALCARLGNWVGGKNVQSEHPQIGDRSRNIKRQKFCVYHHFGLFSFQAVSSSVLRKMKYLQQLIACDNHAYCAYACKRISTQIHTKANKDGLMHVWTHLNKDILAWQEVHASVVGVNKLKKTELCIT